MEQKEISLLQTSSTLNFNFSLRDHESIIKVIGVGGGGGNAVQNMYIEGIRDVSFVLTNTDVQAMRKSEIPTKIALGESITKGLGAGDDPEVARVAAEESAEEIKALFDESTHMVFITAGMGGGTGTGAAPVIARLAKEAGMLTIGVVTIPFKFELNKKIKQALKGVIEMSKHVDALLIVKNEKLLEMYPNVTVTEGFKIVDKNLYDATKSVAEIITVQGKVNLDFRDVSKILSNGGVALMSFGTGSGENRLELAINQALTSPLLHNNDIFSSKKVLFNIYQSEDPQYQLQAYEMEEVSRFTERFTYDDIEVIWGLANDENLKGDQVKITILATGFGINEKLSESSMDIIVNDMYDGKVGRRQLYSYILNDDDMDNDELLGLMEKYDTFSRTSIQLSEIKKLSKTA
ncbi:MAG: cell division protein FtsZ [Bacteroidaceae bacterium]|nr:cell division protein FtsZ [Bacteroidaceae bacterium]